MRRVSLLIAFAIIGLIPLDSSATPADGAVQITPRDRAVVVSRQGSEVASLELPDVPRQVLQHGNLGFVALGPAGLWVVDLAEPARPVVAFRLAEGKDVVGVFVSSPSTIHVIEGSYAVESFDLSTPGTARLVAFGTSVGGPPSPPPGPARRPVAASMTPPATEAVKGSVVQVVGGRAIVDRGSSDGLRVGDRLEILSQELVPKPNLLTGRPEMVPSNETVAVLEVEMLDQHRASAPLHRGDVVHAGDLFGLTSEEPSERLLMPPRQDYRHRVAATLRPSSNSVQWGSGSSPRSAMPTGSCASSP